MYSVIASVKSTAPVQFPASRSESAPASAKFPPSEFLKMLGTAIACGVGTGMVAAAIAMVISQFGA